MMHILTVLAKQKKTNKKQTVAAAKQIPYGDLNFNLDHPRASQRYPSPLPAPARISMMEDMLMVTTASLKFGPGRVGGGK